VWLLKIVNTFESTATAVVLVFDFDFDDLLEGVVLKGL
jgi:hypothetical protein